MPCRAADGYFGETAIRSLVYPQTTDHHRMQQTSTMLLHSNQNRSHDDIQYKNNRHRNQDIYLRQNGLQQRQPVFLLAAAGSYKPGAASHHSAARTILPFGNGRVSGGNFRKTYCSGSTALLRRSADALTVEVLKQKSQKPTHSTPFAEPEPANVGIYNLFQREE